MEQDLLLMVSNAKRYNDPKSTLYKDAHTLKRIITNTRSEIENAMKNDKTYGVKTREKKHAIVLEIAQLESEGDTIGRSNQGNGNKNGNGDGDVDNGVEEEEDEDDDDDEEGEEEEEDEDSNNEGEDSDNNNDEEVDDENTMWTLFTYIKEYRHGNQILIDPFIKLPNRRFYPDYYEEIKKPIALNHVKTNLKKGKYSSLKMFYKDIELIFKNAMSYNREDSSIYLNAKRLQAAALAKFNELEQQKPTQLQSVVSESRVKPIIKKAGSIMIKKQLRLFDNLIDYCESGRNLSKPFLNLPSRETQPNYYEVVKDPIDLDQMRKDIVKGSYPTEAEVIKDCLRVLENAKFYFKVGSQMYDDAVLLEKYINKRNGSSPNEAHVSVASNIPSNASFFNVTVPVITTPNPNYAQLDLKEKLLIIYNYINEYKEQGTKREVAEPFRHLPSKLDYPDYYNVIKKPLDLTKIYNKIINSHYPTCEELIYDFAQCFENACLYNEPGSPIYKDALLLQKLVFFKRIEIDTSLNDDVYTVCDVGAAIQEILVNIFEATFNHQDAEGRKLSDSFLELFNSNLDLSSIGCSDNLLTFQRIKQNLLLKLYRRLDAFQYDMFRMFDQVRRIFDKKSQIYKDSIDLQMFFINKRDEVCKKGEAINSNAFAYKATSLEEDELFVGDSNTNEEAMLNEILQLSYLAKLKERIVDELKLELRQSVLLNGDEKFKLGTNDFIYLNKFPNGFTQEHLKNETSYNNGNMIACVLAIGHGKSAGGESTELETVVDDTKKVKLLVQLYLKPTEINGHKHKYTQNEVFKSDIYEIIDVDQVIRQKCYVISLKDYISYSVECEDDKNLQNMLLCESIYCTRNKLFRKIKKWYTNASNATSHVSNIHKINYLTYDLDKLKFKVRQFTPVVHRGFLNSNEINNIKCYSNDNTVIECKKINILLSQSQATALQENENNLYYEQIVYNNQCFKMGDFVYIKKRLNERNEWVSAVLTQLPVDFDELNKGVIVRIDRLWCVRTPDDPIQQNKLVDNNVYTSGTMKFFIKGPIFLRSIDIHHEPTRLFYKNEVFKDSVREFKTTIDEICGKCVVLNLKKYATSRQTEINEDDVYVCDTKYVSDQRTCRKFTKGLKQFELTHKCYEDEVYFFKKEIRLRKYLSPILLNEKLLIFNINNANISAIKSNDFHLEEETNSNSMFSNEYNNTMGGGDSMHMEVNTSNCSSNMGTPVKASKAAQLSSLMLASSIDKDKSGNYRINKAGKLVRKRVKRSKKCGYNIFSKEFRKKLRDAHSSLSFIEMSREVGNHWRQLTDKERSEYEERAKEESIKEAAKMAEVEKLANENKMKLQQKQHNQNQQHQQLQQQQQQQQQQQLQQQYQQQQQQQQQLQQQQQIIHNIPSNGQHINQIFANQNTSIKQQPMNTAQVPGTNGSSYNIVNFAPPNAVQLNLNYGQNTAYIIKPPNNQSTQADPNGTIQLNDYMQRASSEQQQQQQQPSKGPFVNYQTKPTKPQHTEAYMKYIERIKRSQDSSSRFQYSSNNDWQSYLDVRPSHIRESNMTAAPTNWIENVTNGDVFKHLVSLRYHLLNDAINIKRYETFDEEDKEEAEVIDLSGDANINKPNETAMDTLEA